jgi:uncharacterized protein YeaO (DUF488 family)
MVDNPTVRVRRVYDEPHPDDGTRVLVDRLWPEACPRPGRKRLVNIAHRDPRPPTSAKPQYWALC